jgi:hypothetical protein
MTETSCFLCIMDDDGPYFAVLGEPRPTQGEESKWVVWGVHFFCVGSSPGGVFFIGTRGP